MDETQEKPFEWLGVDELQRRAWELLDSLSDDRAPDTQGDIAAIVAAFQQAANGWFGINSAPKNGTWILLRGRNSAGQPMIPVVAAWMPAGARHQGWADSGSFKPVDNLAADEGADWHPLP